MRQADLTVIMAIEEALINFPGAEQFFKDCIKAGYRLLGG